MLVIVLVGVTALVIWSTLSSTHQKGVRRSLLLLPLIAGLLLTTLVHGADAEIAEDGQIEQRQMLISLEAVGIGLTILGLCRLLSKVRVRSLWMPTDAPFESYKPFKPAYTTTFPVSPIVTPPIFEHSSMTLSEAARYLRISEHDVRMLIDEGSILATQRGTAYLITRRALDDFAYHEQLGL